MKILRTFEATVLAILLIVSSVVGSPAMAAEPTATLSISPKVSTVNNGSTTTVSVFLDTGGQEVDTVSFRVRLYYEFLTCSKITRGSSWTVTAQKSCTDGAASLTVKKLGKPLKGKVKVADVTLLGTYGPFGPGSARLHFDRMKSAVVAASDGTDILKVTRGAMVNVR